MIIFCDIDGTLWRHSDQDFSELKQNIAAVQKWRNAGHLFAIASGRSLASVRRLLPNFTDFTDFLVADNGAFVYDRQAQPIIQNILSAQQIGIIQQALANLPRDQYEFSYYASDAELQTPDAAIGKIRIWFKSPDLIEPATHALNAALPDQLKIHAERHAVKSSLAWVDHSFVSFINVVSIKAGKEIAIQQLLALTNIPDSDTLSIGDDANDLEMLRLHHGHIMADANPILFPEFPPELRHETVASFIESMLAAHN